MFVSRPAEGNKPKKRCIQNQYKTYTYSFSVSRMNRFHVEYGMSGECVSFVQCKYIVKLHLRVLVACEFRSCPYTRLQNDLMIPTIPTLFHHLWMENNVHRVNDCWLNNTKYSTICLSLSFCSRSIHSVSFTHILTLPVAKKCFRLKTRFFSLRIVGNKLQYRRRINDAIGLVDRQTSYATECCMRHRLPLFWTIYQFQRC